MRGVILGLTLIGMLLAMICTSLSILRLSLSTLLFSRSYAAFRVYACVLVAICAVLAFLTLNESLKMQVFHPSTLEGSLTPPSSSFQAIVT